MYILSAYAENSFKKKKKLEHKIDCFVLNAFINYYHCRKAVFFSIRSWKTGHFSLLYCYLDGESKGEMYW